MITRLAVFIHRGRGLIIRVRGTNVAWGLGEKRSRHVVLGWVGDGSFGRNGRSHAVEGGEVVFTSVRGCGLGVPWAAVLVASTVVASCLPGGRGGVVFYGRGVGGERVFWG